MIDRIAPIGFDPNEGIKLLVYGQSGSGKTTFWATFPGPILAILVSGGMQPGELRSIDTPEYAKKIKQVPLYKTDEMGELIDHIKEVGLYKTVVLDHASGLQDLALKEILGLGEEDMLPVQKTFGMATMQQYGNASMVCKEYFRSMLNLRCNVVIVAQERVFGGKEETGSDVIKPTVGAGLTPALTGWLNPACDYVVQTFKRGKVHRTESVVNGQKVTSVNRVPGVEYCLRTEPHDVYQTKFRVPRGRVLPDAIPDPTYEKVMAVIRGTAKSPKP